MFYTVETRDTGVSVGGVIEVDSSASVHRAKRVGTGLSLIVMPLVFVFAFANHPGLLNPHLMSPAGLILRAHNASLLQFGHVLVTLATALLVVVALALMKLLDRTSCAWAGLVGGAVAILGAVILAADKGALCLTMSALDTLPADEFALMTPGLLAMFSLKGWMALLWGMVLLPIGFGIQAVALIKTRVIPRWQGVLFLIGALFIGFPDGAEIVNLTASILMAVALVPYGMRLLAEPGSEDCAKPRLSLARACAGCRRTSVVAGCTRGE